MFELADAAFLGGAPLGGQPRAVNMPAGAATYAAATAPRAGGDSLGSALAPQVMAIAAVCGLLAASRRRLAGSRRPKVARGPTFGTWYEYKFRAKPGDKYKYRAAKDRHEPETGIGRFVEGEGRLIRYGKLFRKGIPLGPAAFKKFQEEQAARAAMGGGDAPGALIFDCDGTLVETERDGHRVAFNKAFQELGFKCEWDVALYGELLTTGGGKERMARYFKEYAPEEWTEEGEATADHPKIQELHALKTKLFMDIVKSGELQVREGIEDMIMAADLAGWKIAVCSTSNEEAVKTVVETYFPRFADRMPVFAGDVVSKKKPDPEIYTLAAKELGLAPMKCVVVEDAAIGLQAAKAAGMQVIVTKRHRATSLLFGGLHLHVRWLAQKSCVAAAP